MQSAHTLAWPSLAALIRIEVPDKNGQLNAHSRHIERLRALSRQVDEATASAAETNRVVEQTRKTLDEARRHVRVMHTHDRCGGRRRHH